MRHQYVAEQSFGSADCGTLLDGVRLSKATKVDNSSGILGVVPLNVSISMEDALSESCTRYECIMDYEFVSGSEFRAKTQNKPV